MKKKGLIISTIVMVVVLIAALTTSTYAWFTTSDKTEITGFNVEIASSNSVNIGMRKGTTLLTGSDLVPDGFVTDNVTFTTTAGALNGTWSGETSGLSNSLTHNVIWGQQTQAIGFAASAPTITDGKTAKTNLKAFSSSSTLVYAANLDTEDSTLLADVGLADANHDVANSENAGDFVYFSLGAQPTKLLTENKLVILVDMTTSTKSSQVGIMSAIHVVYRVSVNGAAYGAWIDADIFGSVHQNTGKSSLNKNVNIWDPDTAGSGANAGVVAASAAIKTAVDNAYNATYGGNTGIPTASCAFVIDGLSLAQGNIDQIEMLIYIDGTDGDSVNAGLGALGAIKMFFQTAA